tara:strand:+ start:632 stop:898 length:267 start_codon:yes stop_codon:yes gene_type:complete
MEKPKYLVLNPVSIAFEEPPEQIKVELYYNQWEQTLDYRRVKDYGKKIYQDEAINTDSFLHTEPESYYYYDINKVEKHIKVFKEAIKN